MNVILSLMLALMPATSPLKQLRDLVSQTQENLSVSTRELRNAPTVVTLDNRYLRLTAYPWRDFNPGSGGLNGTPMMVALKVASADKQRLPNGLRMDRAWVLFNEEMWEVPNLRERKAGQDQDKDSFVNCSNSPACEFTLREGPKWGPGVYVDVIVRLTDSEGQHHFLQAPHQYVLRTD